MLEISNNESKWTQWFRAEVAVAFAIGAAVAGVLIFFLTPLNAINTQMAVIQNEIAQIKNNDIAHIEIEISGINAKLEAQNQTSIDLLKQVVETNTLIKTHMGK